jgi:hypothetical protein
VSLLLCCVCKYAVSTRDGSRWFSSKLLVSLLHCYLHDVTLQLLLLLPSTLLQVTMAVARIKQNMQECLYLGNLDAKRDW